MKRIIYIVTFIAYALPYTVLAQLSGANYVKTKTFLDESGNQYITSIHFYDGLGYPSVQATNGMGIEGKYVYELTEYDKNGRIIEEWCPTTGTTSLQFPNRSNISIMAHNEYADSKAYSMTSYDALGRIVHIGGVGESWDGKYVTKGYDTNAANTVIKYTVNNNGIMDSGYWPRATLEMEETKDEDGCFIQIYRNLEGKTILERRNGNCDTYYVYDSYGRLSYVLQPMYQQNHSLSDYAFHYEYDVKGRCIKKTFPGCSYIQYWYDNYDRQVYMQDGNLRSKSLYRFFLYNQHGQHIIQGLCSQAPTIDNAVVNDMLSYTAGTICDTGYTMTNNPDRGDENLEFANYYNNYNFLYTKTFASVRKDFMTISPASPMGLKTGMITATDDGNRLYSIIRYDHQGRETEVLQTMYNGSTQITQTNYTFTGSISQVKEQHIKDNSCTALLHTYTYYKSNNKLNESRLSYNDNQSLLIASHEYNCLGQLSKINHPGNVGCTEYKYDIHGWIKDIINPRFSQKLFYVDDYGKPCYNGNISRTEWTSNDVTNSYSFYYNERNQLSKAISYSGKNQSGISNRYSESFAYDKNGNITTLQRYGLNDNGNAALIDNLSLYYTGNQLTKVYEYATSPTYRGIMEFVDGVDTPTEFTYDANGNMTSDTNRGITNITYNALNLPILANYAKNNYAEYIYDAMGQKLHVLHYTPIIAPFNPSPLPNDDLLMPLDGNIDESNNSLLATLSSAPSTNKTTSPPSISSPTFPVATGYTTTDYCKNFIYRNNKLYRILFDGGYITLDNDGTPTYHYYLTDYLGSVRVVIDNNGIVEEVNDYYPSGTMYTQNNSIQPYKYCGKELDRMHGLDMYDSEARFHDPILGQWHKPDPKSENYYSWSPYAYCGNNPINRADPKGTDWVKRTVNGISEYYYDRDVTCQEDVNKMYGKGTDITHISNGSKVRLGDDIFMFYNDGKLNKYGKVLRNGEELPYDEIIYGKKYTIFGTSDNSVNARTLHKNLFGTSYTGSNNPLNYLGEESYQYCPRNPSEIGSYFHDLLYDKENAVGAKDAFFNTSDGVMAADVLLVAYNMYNMQNPRSSLIDKGRSLATSSGFTVLLLLKGLKKALGK